MSDFLQLFGILAVVAALGITVGVWLDWNSTKPAPKDNRIMLVRHGNLYESEDQL
ncbi:MAG: hypothetical protein WBA98_01975 [Gordonia sp. (in: high G+C Gram-positive bacteria)]|uniref:hypothetical protein n=1 Tax=Gordonia sp. (in: high G+C Gram-positive bacteria) TaxID=84139 RepID=UPI003C7643FE